MEKLKGALGQIVVYMTIVGGGFLGEMATIKLVKWLSRD